MNYEKLILIGLTALFVAGCASKPIPDPEPLETTPGDTGASTDGFGSDGMGDIEELEYDPDADQMTMVIYFDFDQSELRPEYADQLARHANQLSNNSGSSVRLEGHADERGSREYNIGLGERRAQAVRRTLLIQGASADQISTVSFGEERPAAFGSDEESYSLNRRVEIKYTN